MTLAGVSITAFRTGTAGGTNGPIACAMKGERIKAVYTKAFLVQHGAAPGSVTVMTPSAFMTDDSWDTTIDSVLPGIRQMPFNCNSMIIRSGGCSFHWMAGGSTLAA